MHTKTIKFTILFSFLLASCVAQKVSEPNGTLKGIIGIYEGNCMPGPGVKPCEPRPISTEVLITELSEKFYESLLIKQVKSDDEGQYETSLPPGTYSLFLKDEDKVVCTLIQCPDVCYCHPFKIVSDSTTVIDANLDHATW